MGFESVGYDTLETDESELLKPLQGVFLNVGDTIEVIAETAGVIGQGAYDALIGRTLRDGATGGAVRITDISVTDKRSSDLQKGFVKPAVQPGIGDYEHALKGEIVMAGLPAPAAAIALLRSVALAGLAYVGIAVTTETGSENVARVIPGAGASGTPWALLLGLGAGVYLMSRN